MSKKMQEILNKRNIESLAESNKLLSDRLIKVEESHVGLKSLIMELTLKVQQLTSLVNIQKVMGSTSGT
tara:strand:+ start:2368 stop:2574 length:207 start_codon:yes stop_codon:yes gene_type:complete